MGDVFLAMWWVQVGCKPYLEPECILGELRMKRIWVATWVADNLIPGDSPSMLSQ